MIIEENLSSNCNSVKKVGYVICNDHSETGDYPHELIRVDSLKKAALLLRYLRGDLITDSETHQALEILDEIDNLS